MKRYINYLAVITISSILLTACNKDNFNYKPGYVGESKITNYAVFTLKGTTAVSGVNYTVVVKEAHIQNLVLRLKPDHQP